MLCKPKFTPKFTISSKMVTLCIEITELLTELRNQKFDLKFKEKNIARKIQASLAIEGNDLSCEDVYRIGKEKPVLTTLHDLIETKNAFNVNKIISNIRVYRIKSLLRVHKVLMLCLVEDEGLFRTQSVGISDGKRIIYRAPSFELIPKQIQKLMK